MAAGRAAWWRGVFAIVGKTVVGGSAATAGLCMGVGVYGARTINAPRERWFTDNFVLTPETLRLPYKRVALESDDGVTLDAWFIEQTVRGEASRDLVLCCNPYNQDKSSLLGVARGLWDSGYSVLLFDFRSHATTKTRQTIGHLERRDGDVALDWLCANRPPGGRIGLVGASMGGAVALMLASEQRPEVIACATDCAFSSLKEVIGVRLDRTLPTARLFGMKSVAPLHALFLEAICLVTRFWYGYDPANVGPKAHLADIELPLLVVHSEKDSVVPVEHGYEIYSKSGTVPEQKQFFVVKGAEHIQSFFMDEKEYSRRIVDFFDQVFNSRGGAVFVAGHETAAFAAQLQQVAATAAAASSAADDKVAVVRRRDSPSAMAQLSEKRRRSSRANLLAPKPATE